MSITSMEDLKNKQAEVKKNLDGYTCRVLVCSGTGCIASGAQKIYEKRKEFLQATGTQLDKLDFLIQGMVKTSRLETGVITLELSLIHIFKFIGGYYHQDEKNEVLNMAFDKLVEWPVGGVRTMEAKGAHAFFELCVELVRSEPRPRHEILNMVLTMIGGEAA